MKSRTEAIEGMLESWHAMARDLVMSLKAICRGDATSVTELAEQLSVSSSAATQVVNELVRKGYVLRHTDPSDRRKTRLSLSAGANKELVRMKREMISRFEKLYAALSDSEFKTYLALQEKIMKGRQS